MVRGCQCECGWLFATQRGPYTAVMTGPGCPQIAQTGYHWSCQDVPVSGQTSQTFAD